MFNQENIILPCSSCQAKYNVTNLRAGTKFKCAKCGTVNEVPVQEDAPTEFILRPEVPVKQSPPLKQVPSSPVIPARKPMVKMSAPAPQVAPVSQPVNKAPQPQPRPSTVSSKIQQKPSSSVRPSSVVRPSSLRKGSSVGKVVKNQGAGQTEDSGKKNKKKTWIILGIIGGVVIIIVLIFALKSCGNSEEKMLEEAMKKALAQENEKISQPKTETPKEPEKKPEPEPTKVEEKKPPKEVKPAKPKLEIDEEVKKEIVPLVKDMRNQRDDDQKVTIDKIMAKKKKAIPVLIEIIGDEDDRAATYAYEILIKMTKRNRDDTQKVNPMLNRDMRKECQKEWEEWWFKNKDSIVE
jgi:hypothetical protein